MSCCPKLRNWLAALLTAGMFTAVVLYATLSRNSATNPVQAGAPKAATGDWTMFGGDATRNFVNANAKGLPVDWTDWNEDKTKGTLKAHSVKWSVDLGSRSYGGPIIASGKVFVGTNNQKPRDPKYVKDGKPIDLGVLMAFGESDGKFLWQVGYTKLSAGRVVDWPLEGLCSTPTVEGDRMYYVSNRCEAICADTSGKQIWKLDMINKLGVFPHNLTVCSPLIVGNAVWLITANGVDDGHINVPAPKAPTFLKLDKATGDILWQDNTPTVKLTEANKDDDQEAFIKRLVNRGQLIQHGQWSNPAYAIVGAQPQYVFPGGDGWVYSFDPDGKLLWKFDCNPKDSVYELGSKGTRNDFIATPVIYDNKVYIGVGQDPEHLVGVGHLYCIDMTKRGDVSPELVTDYAESPPKTKPNSNSAQVWHYGGATKAADRKKLKRNYYFGRTMSTCAIKDGLVYAADLNGYLNCLDAATGQLYWTHFTGAETWASPYWADDKIYMGNDGGNVLVFAHGKEKKILAENLMPGPVRATPVAANGVLYVMTANKLYAITDKK